MCGRVCALDSVSKRGKQMVKKAMVLIIAILCAASLYAATSVRFSIVWDNTVESITQLSIIGYGDENETAIQSQALQIVNTEQPVAKIKYASNLGGTHTLSYYATTLTNNSDPKGHAYYLFFEYTENNTTNRQDIQVGTEKNVDYPNGTVSAETRINMGQGGTLTPRYIIIKAQLPDRTIDELQVDVTYTSTVTVVRTSP